MQTVRHGVRAPGDEDTRVSQMPAFGKLEMLSGDEIAAVADYVLSLSGRGSATKEGAQLFADNCAVCHGEAGEGNHELGAPRLNDAIWLYGGDRKTIMTTITNARAGQMPAWSQRLDDATIKQLAVFVHSLGGGE